MLDINWYSEDVISLLLRLIINVVFLTVIVRYVYYPVARKKDYLFTYFLIGFVTFFLCFGLKKLDINIGMGFGLFAIFGIIRYRTSTIEIKEMTYLFAIIGVSVLNSLSIHKISMAELAITNGAIMIIAYALEHVWFRAFRVMVFRVRG